jgi:glycine/D-amino acid oxidase-like deaminating enzyme
LSAAHELAERGFDVTVYEARETFGGKARSMPVPGSGNGGRPDLPAEHGFRFFPGFYRHLPDTMARIPDGSRNDRRSPRAGDADPCSPRREDGASWSRRRARVVARRPRRDRAFVVGVRHLGGQSRRRSSRCSSSGCSRCSCRATSGACRVGAAGLGGPTSARTGGRRVPEVPRDGLTRTLVAARAREISARTGGLIMCQLVFDLTRAGGRADRVLDAPTSEAWIDPVGRASAGARRDAALGSPVAGIDCDGHRVTGVTIGGGTGRVTADHYVARCRSSGCGCSSPPRCAPPSRGSRRSRGWSRAG